MNEAFKLEGPLYRIADTFCGLVWVGILWLLCCIPIVTIGTSNTAAYYAVAKAVRAQNGKVTQEFFRSFRSNLKDGCFVQGIYLIFVVLAGWNCYQGYFTSQDAVVSGTLVGIWGILLWILLVLSVVTSVYMSRYAAGRMAVFKMALFSMFRHFWISIAITGMLVAGGILVYVWIPGILIVPGLWFYGLTYLMEGILRKYSPPQQEEVQYDELGNRIEKWYETLSREKELDVQKKAVKPRQPKKQLHKYKKYR